MRTINKILSAVIFLIASTVAFGQCNLVINPITGLLDCTGSGGSSSPFTGSSEVTTSYSATPTFTIPASTAVVEFKITLTGNVTSSTLVTSGAISGQIIVYRICQDGTGSRTFVFPTNVLGAAAIAPTANVCTVQMFNWDGTNVNSSSVAFAITSSTSVLAGAASGGGVATLPAGSGNLPYTYTINAQTGTSYTFASTDCYQYVTSNNAATTTSFAVPQANTTTFPNGCQLRIKNIHPKGKVDISTSTSTFLGTAQTGRFFLLPFASATIISNATDWNVEFFNNNILCNLNSSVTGDYLAAGDTGPYNGVTATNIGTTKTNFNKTCTIPANMITTTTALNVRGTFYTTGGGTPPNSTGNLRLGASGTIDVWTGNSVPMPVSTQATFVDWIVHGNTTPGANAGVWTGASCFYLINSGCRSTTSAYPVTTSVATNAAQVLAISQQYAAATAGNLVALIGLQVRVDVW